MRLREIRKAKGRQQKELAEKIGTDEPMMSKFENYKCLPIPSMMRKLLKELGCSRVEEIYEPHEVYLQLASVYGIKHKLIKPRTPRHNGKVERSHRTDQECFYDHLQYSTYEELKEKMAEWLNRYNNRPHSSLRNRAGKRVWLTPLQKRAELMEDYLKIGFKDENDKEIKIRFLKKSA